MIVQLHEYSTVEGRYDHKWQDDNYSYGLSGFSVRFSKPSSIKVFLNVNKWSGGLDIPPYSASIVVLGGR